MGHSGKESGGCTKVIHLVEGLQTSDGPRRLPRVRRLLAVLAGVLLVAGGIYLVMTVASGRETGGGVAGDQAAGPGELEPAVNGPPQKGKDPPTSGEHAKRNLTREGRVDTDELLTALEQGNVVIA